MDGNKLFSGLIIERHKIVDAESKLKAQDDFKGWSYQKKTFREWIDALESGQTICIGNFEPEENDRYRHKKELWLGTRHVLTDADHIRGIEFNDKGKDVNPNGLEPFESETGLSELYPDLKKKARGVGQSVSSMSELHFIQHRRYRIAFEFDKLIRTQEQYSHVLSKLAQQFPIISPVDRHPAQPVFGNAREGFRKWAIMDNILSLNEYLSDFGQKQDTSQIPTGTAPTQKRGDGHGTHNATQRKYQNNLDGLIADAKLTRHETGDDGTVRVDCPFNSSHDQDAFVKLDSEGFPTFKCHHNSCAGKGFNDMAQLTGIEVPYNQDSKKRGRPSRAEQAQKVVVPPEINKKPVVMLQGIENVDEEVIIAERSRDIVSDEVSEHLWRNGKVRLYRRGKELGSLRPSEDGLLFYPASKASLGGDIARTVSLIRYGHDGKPTPIANAPGWLAEDILLNQNINDVPQIKVILTHPFFNGSNIVDKHGYDPDSQVFLDREKSIKFDLDTQTHTAPDDLKLWRELLKDFPFKEESDFQNAIGYMLTLLIRQGLKVGEATPLFDVTAPREGVGKSLLADVLTAAVIGQQPITRSLGTGKGDVEKEMGAALRGAPEVLILDNVDPNQKLDSGTLASIITNPRRAFRILGYSEEAFFENRAVTLYTGSNVELTSELAKRMVAIRLSDPGIAEKDRKVEIDGILEYTIENRDRYCGSLLRMVKRWIDAGCVESKETKHRMRQWSRVIRGIMESNSFGEAFLENTDAVTLQANPDFTIWANGFKAIAEELGDKAFEGWTSNDVFQILSYEKEVYAHQDDINGRNYTRSAKGQGIFNELIGEGTDHYRKVKLGKLLRSKDGAVYGGYKLIDLHKSRKRAKLFALKQIEMKQTHHQQDPEPEASPNGDANTLDTVLGFIDGQTVRNSTEIIQGVMNLTQFNEEEAVGFLKELIDENRIIKRTHNGEMCYIRAGNGCPF